jgi:hypothetical protein
LQIAGVGKAPVQGDRGAGRHRQHRVHVGGALVWPQIRVLDRPRVLETVPIVPAAWLPEFVRPISFVRADDRAERQVAEPFICLRRLAMGEDIGIGVVVFGWRNGGCGEGEKRRRSQRKTIRNKFHRALLSQMTLSRCQNPYLKET